MFSPVIIGSGTAVINSYEGVIQQRKKREGAIVQWHSFMLNIYRDLHLINMDIVFIYSFIYYLMESRHTEVYSIMYFFFIMVFCVPS